MVVVIALFYANVYAQNELPIPILEYKFNEVGEWAPSTGSNSSALELTYYLDQDNKGPIDLHSADGLGVSGKAGDRALDNTQALGMGNTITPPEGRQYVGYGRAQTSSGIEDIDELKSFTISFWFKAPEQPAGEGRIFEKAGNFALMAMSDANGSYLTLWFPPKGHNTQRATIKFSEVNEWVFVVITYDGTITSNNIKFYKGKLNERVQLVATDSRTDPAPGRPTSKLSICESPGNYYDPSPTFSRPFRSFLDNFRIYGDKSASEGCLSMQQLEQLRIMDIGGEDGLVFADPARTTLTADYTSRPAGGTVYPVSVTVFTVNQLGDAIDGQLVKLQQISGPEVVISESDGVIAQEGIATFTVTSRNQGTVAFNAYIYPGYDIEPIVSESHVAIEFTKPPLVELTRNPIIPESSGDRSNTAFRMFLSTDCKVDLLIYDKQGRVAATLMKDHIMSAGLQEFVWDGLADGRRMRPGIYTYYIFTTSIEEDFPDNSWASGTIGIIN